MVIYVDKPLPPTSMTTEEKTNFRCKRGTRFVLQIPWCNQGSGRKRAPGQKRSNTRTREHLPAPAEPEQVSGGFFEDSVDLSVLETFGTSVANTLQQVKLIIFVGSLLKQVLLKLVHPNIHHAWVQPTLKQSQFLFSISKPVTFFKNEPV